MAVLVENQVKRLWIGLALIPPAVFWIIAILACVFRIDGPAQFLGGWLVSYGWVGPLLLLLTIGFPTVCVISCLVIRKGGPTAWVALFLLISNIALMPLFLLLLAVIG
ncbi:MAG: hypothetical protein AB1705_03570 [Verrucomicrobiota bacterium]